MNKLLIAALTVLLLASAGSGVQTSEKATDTTQVASSYKLMSDGDPPM